MKLSERFINAINEDSIIGRENAHVIEDAINFIRRYEDAEEQRRLVILPCKVGETVWRVNFDKRRKRIEEIRFDVNVYNAFGKTVFLSREEAEAALTGGQDGV